MVAAIDFGTTYSGYAFSWRHDYLKNPLKIQTNTAWNAGGRQLMSLKAPTCVLLNKQKELESFGYEAENRYTDIVIDGEQNDYYYFHRFKMNLHKNEVFLYYYMLRLKKISSTLTKDFFGILNVSRIYLIEPVLNVSQTFYTCIMTTNVV